MKFEFYVLNEDHNAHKIISFNIFQNWPLQEAVEKEVRKYLRAPNKYEYRAWRSDEVITGFDALCREIDDLIKWQERMRCEYEIAVGSMFDKDGKTYRKIDCYEQAAPNIRMITHEVIRQYKEQKKNEC